MKWLLDKMRDQFKGSHAIALTATQNGYHPAIVQRPVIGVGNAPQYWLDAQMLSFNSVAGGGTLAGNPPRAVTGQALFFQPQMVAAPVQQGNLTGSRQFVGLMSEKSALEIQRGEKF